MLTTKPLQSEARGGAVPSSKPWRVGQVDVPLAAVVVALLGFGLTMVFSASAIEATVSYQDPYHFLKRQGAFMAIGGDDVLSGMFSGSITASPLIVANHMRPSLVFHPAGCPPPLHSRVNIPSGGP